MDQIQEETENSNYPPNSYRVLLTRDRDGFVTLVPPVKEMDAVYIVLLQAGIMKVEYYS